MMRQPDGGSPRDRAFSILGSVAQGNTRWSVVYEATAGRVTWRTRTSGARKELAIADLDFSCAPASRGIDANTPSSGNVAPFLESYGTEANLAQLLLAYASTSFLRSVPRESVEATAAHAWLFECAPGRRLRGARR
jgi:hypothetical protein